MAAKVDLKVRNGKSAISLTPSARRAKTVNEATMRERCDDEADKERKEEGCRKGVTRDTSFSPDRHRRHRPVYRPRNGAVDDEIDDRRTHALFANQIASMNR
jgi:hypothetical protein